MIRLFFSFILTLIALAGMLWLGLVVGIVALLVAAIMLPVVLWTMHRYRNKMNYRIINMDIRRDQDPSRHNTSVIEAEYHVVEQEAKPNEKDDAS